MHSPSDHALTILRICALFYAPFPLERRSLRVKQSEVATSEAKLEDNESQRSRRNAVKISFELYTKEDEQ